MIESKAQIKVIIIDDHILFAEGISALLAHSAGIKVVAKVTDSTQAVDRILNVSHDVILMDYQMPKLNGLEVLEKVRCHNSRAKVIMLSTFDNHDLVKMSMRAGALGYLRKDIDFKLLVRAIESVYREERFIQPFFSEMSNSSGVPHSPMSNRIEALTSGELQVLKLIAAGFSNLEIAEMLFKSKGRVRNIVSSLLSKMNARDRTQAAIQGIESGIL